MYWQDCGVTVQFSIFEKRITLTKDYTTTIASFRKGHLIFLIGQTFYRDDELHHIISRNYDDPPITELEREYIRLILIPLNAPVRTYRFICSAIGRSATGY